MKLSIRSAVLILSAGMLLILAGVYMKGTYEHIRNPVILAGLIFEFTGTIWMVLSLNQRRRKN